MINTRFLLVFLVWGIFSCKNEKHTLWPENGTELIAKTYKLDIGDTTLLKFNNDQIELISKLKVLECINSETVHYENLPDGNDVFSLFTKKNMSIKYSSSNLQNKEVYISEGGAVKLVGYYSSDNINSSKKFSQPLTILPPLTQAEHITDAYIQKWNAESNQFINDTKVKVSTKYIKTINYQGEDAFIIEVIFSGDARISHGNNELIVPDAYTIKSILLYGMSKGLLYEWSIKNERTADEETKIAQESNFKRYIELIKYTNKF
jgi:hypothetical protein